MKNSLGIYLLAISMLLLAGSDCIGASQPATSAKMKPIVNPVTHERVIIEDQDLPDLTFVKPISVRKEYGSDEIREREFVRLLSGESYVFLVEVTNKGSAPSSTCRLLYKVFSKEPNEQNFSELQGRVFHFNVPALFPNTKAEMPLVFKPENTGLFYLYAKVDPSDQVQESDESNNLTILGQQLVFQVQKPFVDLAVEAWVGEPKVFKHLSTVESVKIHFNVRNEGTIPLQGGEIQVIFHNSRAGTKRCISGIWNLEKFSLIQLPIVSEDLAKRG